jgi:2-oxoglutarate ferredoxin oxidoreductase subunit beta
MTLQKTTWCPGCGNFPILDTATRLIKEELKLKTSSYVIVSGIGQAAKLPHYFKGCNFFNGLHGRAIPVATGIKMANHKLKVFVFSGDGDLLAEGGNHFIHAIRRNIGITCVLHNNQVYGLTKGQASPTADLDYTTKIQYMGVKAKPFYPLKTALVLGAGFVARTTAGNKGHMKEILKEAVNYNGFALVDILQPCVAFNKKNTYQWYKEHTTILDDSYDSGDLELAMKIADRWDHNIPLGIIYRKELSSYEEKLPLLQRDSLVSQSFNAENIQDIL